MWISFVSSVSDGDKKGWWSAGHLGIKVRHVRNGMKSVVHRGWPDLQEVCPSPSLKFGARSGVGNGS